MREGWGPGGSYLAEKEKRPTVGKWRLHRVWIPTGRKAGAVLMICTLWNPQNPSEPEKNKYSDLTSENWKCSEFEGCIFKAAPFMVVKQNKAKGINDRSIKWTEVPSCHGLMSLTEWVTIRTCRFDDVLEKQDVGWRMLYDTILENKRKQSAPARARVWFGLGHHGGNHRSI